jgi:hypothetical protein
MDHPPTIQRHTLQEPSTTLAPEALVGTRRAMASLRSMIRATD